MVTTQDKLQKAFVRGSSRDWMQMAGAYALVQMALWTQHATQAIFALVAAAWIVAGTLLSRDGPRQLGITARGFRQSLWIIPVAGCVGLLLVASAWMAGTLHVLHGRQPVLWHTFLYFVWALVQEFIVQSFFFVRIESVLENSRGAVIATALLFCAAHIPNPVLIAATFLLALALTEVFRRNRNLYPLAIAHGLLGLALAVSVPDALSHHMRVGIAYWF